MINGSNHDFLSNQFLGPIDGTAPYEQINVGGDGMGGFTGTLSQIDLNDNGYASGEQFFTVCVIPEPSSLALVDLSLAPLLGFGRSRRARL